MRFFCLLCKADVRIRCVWRSLACFANSCLPRSRNKTSGSLVRLVGSISHETESFSIRQLSQTRLLSVRVASRPMSSHALIST
uniref:Secreted protein n=1 Tax=Steinernema glaseri TaxID=37863 RepID=A0A1I7ZDB1_9BILA